MRFSIAGLALLVALGLTACGSTTVRDASDSGGAGMTTTVTRTRTAGPSDASAAVTTAQTTATTGPGEGSGGAGVGTTAVAGATAPPCTAAGLRLTFLGGQGATGHGLLGFAVRNIGTGSCSTIGYPGVQFLAQGGSSLPTTPTHTTNDFFGPTTLRMLTVAPGRSASFRLGVDHDGAACTTAYGLQVIPPNDTATMRISLPDGASECGTATVSPMQPGDSAYP